MMIGAPGPSEIAVLIISSLLMIIPLAITIWLIISVQAIKNSVRNIERSLEARSSGNQDT